MQGDTETETFDSLADRVLHVRDTCAGFVGGFQHARADLRRIADIFVDREHREQPVAHIFQHLAAMRPDRCDLAVEILIENVHDRLGGEPVRQRGEASQIEKHDGNLAPVDPEVGEVDLVRGRLGSEPLLAALVGAEIARLAAGLMMRALARA